MRGPGMINKSDELFVTSKLINLRKIFYPRKKRYYQPHYVTPWVCPSPRYGRITNIVVRSVRLRDDLWNWVVLSIGLCLSVGCSVDFFRLRHKPLGISYYVTSQAATWLSINHPLMNQYTKTRSLDESFSESIPREFISSQSEGGCMTLQ